MDKPNYLPEGAADRLSKMIQVPLVSQTEPGPEEAELGKRFQGQLKGFYPRLFSAAAAERVGEYGFTVTWPGKDPALSPLVLLAHYDVVPAEDAEHWKHPPFSGAIAEGFIWGRGAQDTKITLAGALEAAEDLAVSGFVPGRTIIFAFGADEEIGGEKGAAKIAALFRERGIKPALVIDEGSVITRGMFSPCPRPLAMIGVEEKGRFTVKISVRGRSGHASRPPKRTAAGLLGAALYNIEKRPFPARLIPSVKDFFRAVAPHTSFPMNMILSRPGLFGFLLKKVLLAGPDSASLAHTTAAITFVRSGLQENVLPEDAEALLNVRVLPGESINRVLDRIRSSMKVKEASAEIWESWKPNEPITGYSPKAEGYNLVSGIVRELVPEAVPVPNLISVSTDSRHYSGIAAEIIRFVPIIQNRDDLKGIHGRDEKISLENYGLCFSFYRKLIKQYTE